MCRGIDEQGLEFLSGLLRSEEYGPGEFICREGEQAEKVYFLERGRVSVSLRLDNQHERRLGAFTAGWVFGEAAFFDRRKRTADILADTGVSLFSLDPLLLRQSENEIARDVQHRLLANLAEINLGRLGRANNDIRVLTR
jgi:CRP-like cAMP-binding protein